MTPSRQPSAAPVNAVKSCQRTLQVLELFSRRLRDLTLTEIAHATGSPKSSCLAILGTMVNSGYLYRVSARPSYYPTRRWFEQSRVLLDHDPVGATIRETLARISEATGETTIDAVYADGASTYLDVVESTALIRFSARIGDRKPLHVSASGRAQLLKMPAAARNQALQQVRYERCSGKGPAGRQALERVLAREREQGWSVNLGEYQADVVSVASGYLLHGEAHALVIAGPYARVSGRVQQIGRMLRAEAAELERRLS